MKFIFVLLLALCLFSFASSQDVSQETMSYEEEIHGKEEEFSFEQEKEIYEEIPQGHHNHQEKKSHHNKHKRQFHAETSGQAYIYGFVGLAILSALFTIYRLVKGCKKNERLEAKISEIKRNQVQQGAQQRIVYVPQQPVQKVYYVPQQYQQAPVVKGVVAPQYQTIEMNSQQPLIQYPTM